MEDVLVAAGWLKAKGVGMNIQGNMRCSMVTQVSCAWALVLV